MQLDENIGEKPGEPALLATVPLLSGRCFVPARVSPPLLARRMAPLPPPPRVAPACRSRSGWSGAAGSGACLGFACAASSLSRYPKTFTWHLDGSGVGPCMQVQ